MDSIGDNNNEADKELESLKQISQKRQLLQQKLLEQKVAAKKSTNSTAKKEDPKTRQISPAPSKISVSSANTSNRHKKYDYRRFVGIDTSSSENSNHSIFHSDNSSMSEGEPVQLGSSDLLLNESFDGLEILNIQSKVKYESTKASPTVIGNSRKRLMEERNGAEEQVKKKQKLLPPAGPVKFGGRSINIPPKATSKYSHDSNTNATKWSKSKK